MSVHEVRVSSYENGDRKLHDSLSSSSRYHGLHMMHLMMRSELLAGFTRLHREVSPVFDILNTHSIDATVRNQKAFPERSWKSDISACRKPSRNTSW